MEGRSVIVEHLDRDGSRVLAIETGMTPRVLAQSKLVAAMSGHGLIVRSDGTTDEWIPEGTFVRSVDGHERTYVYGPDFDAEPLSTLAEGDRTEAWKNLHAAITAVNRAYLDRKLTDSDMTQIAGAGPLALLPARDGTVLILPGNLVSRCVAAHGEETEIAMRLLWVHPDYRTLNPSWAFSFMAGTIAYRIAAGVPPFAAHRPFKRGVAGSEAIGIDIRNGFFEPIDTAVWAIRPAAAACVNALVSSGTATSVDTLASFGPSIDSVIDPARESVPESEEFAAKRVAFASRLAADARREDILRRYRTAFIAGGVALVACVALVVAYVMNRNAGPDTLSLKPIDVVEGYYAAVEKLDQETADAYCVKGLKTEYDNYMTNFYVTSRIRLSYEGSLIVTPEDLYALRDPGTNMIYGITRYESSDLMASNELAACTVSFYYWLPVSAKEGDTRTTGVLLSIVRRKDKVTLEYAKNRWKISGIEPLESEDIPVDGDVLLKLIKSGAAEDLPYAPAAAEMEKAENARAAERAAKSGPLF